MRSVYVIPIILNFILTLRSIHTQHSVDWKVSIGGADGAEDGAEAMDAGGADGIFS